MNTCQKVKKVQNQFGWGFYKEVCGKPANYFLNGIHMCRHHAKKGRYVIRDGEQGDILERFDTEKEMREAIIRYPGKRMQKITNSHRTDYN